jgi:dienelactone hydrolase
MQKRFGRLVRAVAIAATITGTHLASTTGAYAQMPTITDSAAPPVFAGEMKLKTASPALATATEGWVKIGNSYVVHNVATPTLTPFLPTAGKGNGTAVVIAPGGGFMMLSMSSEGWDVARWLAANGIAAFVLKYRLTATPASAAGLQTTMVSKLAGRDSFQRTQWFTDGTRVAVEDAAEAMRVVRANAAKWNIDPAKVGFMGFSAGAFTTLGLVNRNEPQSMPNFVAPIYGSMSTPDAPLPAVVPPMWTSLAADDPILGKTDFGLLNAWRAKGGTVEFHLYDKGGHGYGLAGTPRTTTVHWPQDFLNWLESRGLYTAGSPKR